MLTGRQHHANTVVPGDVLTLTTPAIFSNGGGPSGPLRKSADPFKVACAIPAGTWVRFYSTDGRYLFLEGESVVEVQG